MASGGDEKDFIIGFDNRRALWPDGFSLTEDGGNPGFDIGHVLFEGCQSIPDQRATIVGFNGDKADSSASKINYL